MPDVRVGDQRPRLSNVPQGVRSEGPDATELAALCGLHLDPWQAYALDCLLQRRANGRWVTKTGLLVVPRQNGKGAVDEAWELSRIFLLKVPEVRHTAHHARTAKDAFEKMRYRIKASDVLDDRLMPDRSGGIRTANGEWGFTFRSGQKLTYSTRTEGAGRAFALEVADDRSWACIAAAGMSPKGYLHVECGEYRRGTAWVVPYLKDLASRRAVKVVVQPSSQAGSLISELEAIRVRVMRSYTAGLRRRVRPVLRFRH
jgi:hypothetical protein